MKSVPTQKNLPISITVEFDRTDLIALEDIGANSKSIEQFLTRLSFIAANIKTAPIDNLSEEKRNETIQVIRDSISELKKARVWLFDSEYPGELVEELVNWSNELRPTVRRRIKNDSRREIVPSDQMAIGSVAVLLRGIGCAVNANSQTNSPSSFLTALNIVFRAAGEDRSERSLSESFYRFSTRWGLNKILEDARYLCMPTYRGYGVKMEIAYSRGMSFSAKFSYSPKSTFN
ncbi:MAG: hypothetical protein ACH255_11925 [Candidatus Thiodiazotropha sp.]